MATDRRSDPGMPPRPMAQAVALSYSEGDASQGLAPKVIATGQGRIAETIIAKAREAGVPVHASRELVAVLMHFDLDQRIPPALYVAVAEVLAWVYRLERRPDNADLPPSGRHG